MQELENEHKLERQSEDAVLEIVRQKTVLTNQEVYNFYAKLKADRMELDQRLKKSQKNIETLQSGIEKIDTHIKKWMSVAVEAEKHLPKLEPEDANQPLKVKDELEKAAEVENGTAK